MSNSYKESQAREFSNLLNDWLDEPLAKNLAECAKENGN